MNAESPTTIPYTKFLGNDKCNFIDFIVPKVGVSYSAKVSPSQAKKLSLQLGGNENVSLGVDCNINGVSASGSYALSRHNSILNATLSIATLPWTISCLTQIQRKLNHYIGEFVLEAERENARNCLNLVFQSRDQNIGIRFSKRLLRTMSLLGGGEVYYSAKDHIGGLSFGIQNSFNGGHTLSAFINPLMGHVRLCHEAFVTTKLKSGLLFDYNLYSIDSDLLVGLNYKQEDKANCVQIGLSTRNGFGILLQHRITNSSFFTFGLSTGSLLKKSVILGESLPYAPTNSWRSTCPLIGLSLEINV